MHWLKLLTKHITLSPFVICIKKISKGEEWILITDEDVNVDFVQYAEHLGWENKEVYKSTWSGRERVPFAMIAELLNELSFNQKQEFSPNERRTSKYFNDLKKMQNKFFFNKNLFKLDKPIGPTARKLVKGHLLYHL